MQGCSPQELKSRLAGAIAFPITPFTPDHQLDLHGVAANADWLAQSDDIVAIVAPSGTGEFFALTPDEVTQVTQATIQAANRRKPVIASVGINAHLAAQQAAQAERDGADGILILPPYYATPDARGLQHYYQHISRATRLGVMPYARDAAHFTPDLLDQLTQTIPNLVAFKDGRGDVRLFQRLREHVIDQHGEQRLAWLCGVGDDLVAAYFAAGAEGFTSSLACFWPEASGELFRLAAANNFAKLHAFHERVVRPIYELRQRGRGFEVSVMKAAMELLGHPAGPPRPPLGTLSERDRSDLKDILRRLEVPTAATRKTLVSVG